jgi:hypothetical protein
MAHAKTIQAKLAQSLDKANSAEAAEKASAAKELDRVRREYLDKVSPLKGKLGMVPAPDAAAPAGKGGCTKLSVSLFPGDMARLDAICSYMAARGVRLSTSQAVKVALRTAPLSDALSQALDSIRAEDGRKW